MRPLQPVFDPSKYAERADCIFRSYNYPEYPLPIVGPFSYFSYLGRIDTIRRHHDLGEGFIRKGVLIWGKGEPILPYQTKLGGCPYRPKHLPWPRGTQGQFLPFIAQINFSTAEEHKFEKELLLVFGEIIEDDVLEFHAEWYSPQNGDELTRVSPPESIIWPKDVYYAEMAELEVFPEAWKSKTLVEEIKNTSGLGNIREMLAPSSSLVWGWDGSAAAIDELPEPIAAFNSLNPYFATALAWLNEDETDEDVKARAANSFLGGRGTGGYPNRWFNVGDMGRFVVGINEAGEVEGWIESH
jgi:Domain of unknown function (DUF1963)